MNQSRGRKIGYLLAMVALFSTMIGVGRMIDYRQSELGIAQKSLGKVNPVSGIAQLVFGGFRGVAVVFLWHDAYTKQREGRYFEIEPIVRSITLLQPNFTKPWEFQAWNYAYNIAAEWESVDDKYFWIQKGVDFMKNANEINRKNADLEWYVGFMYSTKFGSSDEKKYLRELFRNDDDLEFVQSSSGVKDSFLKAYDWFHQANSTCISLNRPPGRMAPHTFLDQPALAKSQYSEALNDEGTFGSFVSQAWRDAYREWVSFGMLGGRDRHKDFIYRLEYTPAEMEALTDEERFWRHHYNRMIRYDFWKIRCETEASEELQAAREAIYQANDARVHGAYSSAIDLYEKGMAHWRHIMETNETYREDMLYQEDCQEMEDDYLRLLAHVGRPTPARRPFDGIVKPLRDSVAGMLDAAAQEARERQQAESDPPKAPPSGASESADPPKAPANP